ncbi:hypothetical protein EPN87_04515 [archaeon]|nr:MAG: hypothetical protein EPN87_04515 [archaeon]
MNKMILVGVGAIIVLAVAGFILMQGQTSSSTPSLSTGTDTSAAAIDASASSFIDESTPTADQTLPGLS